MPPLEVRNGKQMIEIIEEKEIRTLGEIRICRAIVDTINEYDQCHENPCNVIHLGSETYKEAVELLLSLAPNETERIKSEAEYSVLKNHGQLFGELTVVHVEIPHMILCDYVEPPIDMLDSDYHKEFLTRPETISHLAGIATEHILEKAEAKAIETLEDRRNEAALAALAKNAVELDAIEKELDNMEIK